jgi:hypothetical protein
MIWRPMQRIIFWWHAKRNGPPKFSVGDDVFVVWEQKSLYRFDFGPFEGIVTEVGSSWAEREWIYEVRTQEPIYIIPDGSRSGPHMTFAIRESQLSPSIRARRNEILEDLGI